MSTEWKQRPEGGGRFALWLIRSIGCYGGRGVSRLLLYPITLYFLIRRGPERAASCAWLSRALGRRASLWDAAKHTELDSPRTARCRPAHKKEASKRCRKRRNSAVFPVATS